VKSGRRRSEKGKIFIMEKICQIANYNGKNMSNLSKEELEDIGLAKLMHNIGKTKKESRLEIMKKLNS
jgi:HD-GYP domain-containing protein (c-di-GMP phosphodiesterase class II)